MSFKGWTQNNLRIKQHTHTDVDTKMTQTHYVSGASSEWNEEPCEKLQTISMTLE